MGLGLWECQVRLVTHFWICEDVGTHGAWEDPYRHPGKPP